MVRRLPIRSMKMPMVSLIAVIFSSMILFSQEVEQAEEQRFVAAFKQALSERDSQAIEALVYWNGASDYSVAKLKHTLKLLLTHKAIKIEIPLLLTGDNTYPKLPPGIPKALSLPISRALQVEFEWPFPTNDQTHPASKTLYLPLGVKDDKLYIACPLFE